MTARLDLVSREDADYEARRRGLTWNHATPERYPRAMVKARDVSEVEEAVRFAADKGWVVAARSGGHSHVGSSLRDGALVIDVSALDFIELDLGARKARVGPGVTSKQLAVELARHGFAFAVGHCGSVALGGYLLGGGHGYNWSQWGPACYSVAGLEVVGKDGSLRTIDDESEPDLMWLARGCGPSFPGVVTAYHLDLQPLPPSIMVSTYAFDLDDLSEVTGWYDELSLPTSVERSAALAGPILDPSAPPDARYVLIYGLAFEQDAAAAQAALAPLQAAPAKPALANEMAPMEFVDLFTMVDLLLPPDGTRLHADSAWCDASTQRILETLEEHIKSSPSPTANLLCYPPPETPLQDNACFSMVTGHCVTRYALHDSPDDDQVSSAWIAEGARLLEPMTAGYWVGETDLLADDTRARRSFLPERWARARKIRSTYDPDGLFADYLRSDS